MRHTGKYRSAAAMGVAVLAAGLLAVVAPAGTALASPAAAPAAASTPDYNFDAVATGIKALGHTWSVEVSAGNGSDGSVGVNFWTQGKGATENHLWETSPPFAPAAARDLTVTSNAHATFKTGSALRPVLAASLAFTPLKGRKGSCAKGSSTSYTGYVTGTVTLVTGLRGVKVTVKFSRKSADASLTVDRSCVPPVLKPLCGGAGWLITAAGNGGAVGEEETLGDKPPWDESIFQAGIKTASKWFTRLDNVDVVGGTAPKLNKSARTVTVALTASTALVGRAVISYTMTSTLPATTCYVGGKRYSETVVEYFGSAKATERFQARTALTGTLTLKPADAIYTGYSLKAK
jgi:hypothetical protein